MLRITADLDSDPIVLKVEGKLKGPWVTELEHCWQSAGASWPGYRLRIELNRLYLGLFLAVVLAMQMWPQKAHAAAGRNDQEIQQQAAKVLSTKDKWKGITATTEDGIVTLEGSVSLYVDKVDAGRKIGKINHADGVRNHVQVEGNVPDNELQSKLADKLSYDRIGYGIMFNALSLEDGVVTVGGDVSDYPSRDSALAIFFKEQHRYS